MKEPFGMSLFYKPFSERFLIQNKHTLPFLSLAEERYATPKLRIPSLDKAHNQDPLV
jgi:hypothetical protein